MNHETLFSGGTVKIPSYLRGSNYARMPMFTALLAFWLTSSYFSVDVYNWWYIGLYPGFLGILCSIIGKKDKQKKNYTIWSLPCGMEQIWDAKILVGIKMSAVAVAGLTLFP